MTTVDLETVERIRARIAASQLVAAERFRDAFSKGLLPPVAHLRIQAEALLEAAQGVKLRGRIAYDVIGDLVTPYVERGVPIYPSFEVLRTPEAILEYWLIVSELEGSSAWRMTRLIASGRDYDEALKRMESPQIVRALVATYLPSADVQDDGTAMLEVCVYARAGEERIERRQLLLSADNEFSFHGRQLLAEGRGGLRV